MAIYEFACGACGKVFDEYYDSMSGPKEHVCKCGAKAKRSFCAMPHVKYVGKGFYGAEAVVAEKKKEVMNIADNMYVRRAEQSAKKNPIDDDWYQQAAKIVGK